MAALSEFVAVSAERLPGLWRALQTLSVCPHCVLRALRVEIYRFYALPPEVLDLARAQGPRGAQGRK